MSDSLEPDAKLQSEMDKAVPALESAQPKEWLPLPERIAAETESRPGRIEKLMARAESLFPAESWVKVAPLIRRQLDTPQWGDEAAMNAERKPGQPEKVYHHHEGVFMDTHLDEILATIDRTATGQIPDQIHESDRAMLQELAANNQDLLARYAFLHDLSKPDTLRITSLDAAGKPVITEYSWEEWQAQLPSEIQSGSEPVLPATTAQYLTDQKIIQISYFHQGKERGEGRQHGDEGAGLIESLGLTEDGVPSYILHAIRKHEVAYQFSSIKVETFDKHLGSLTDDEAKFAMAASYFDTMGSLGSDGHTDLRAVRALFDSAHNARLIRDAEAVVRLDFTGDEKKLETNLAELRKSQTRNETSVATLAGQLREKSRETVYNIARLGELLQTQEDSGALTKEQSRLIHQAVVDKKVGELGRSLGKTMQIVKPLLAAAEQQ